MWEPMEVPVFKTDAERDVRYKAETDEARKVEAARRRADNAWRRIIGDAFVEP